MEAVAAPRGRTDPPVTESLRREPHRFEFHQAVRLLELIHGGREPVRFSGWSGLGFPAAEIVRVEEEPGRPGARMTVAFLGLTGFAGPLPHTITELVLERAARRDYAPRDFLDIFNHRLLSLFHEGWRRRAVAVEGEDPAGGAAAARVFACIGLGAPALRGRTGLDDRPLLGSAGLLADRRRSAVGLQSIVARQLGVPCRVTQFVGAWLPLPDDQTTRLGAAGQRRALGRDTVLGTRVWDQHAGVALRLGPLPLPRFLDLLPGGPAHRALAALLAFYAGTGVRFRLVLALRATEVPPARLGRRDGPRLGHTAWLGRRPPSADPEVTVAVRG